MIWTWLHRCVVGVLMFASVVFFSCQFELFNPFARWQPLFNSWGPVTIYDNDDNGTWLTIFGDTKKSCFVVQYTTMVNRPQDRTKMLRKPLPPNCIRVFDVPLFNLDNPNQYKNQACVSYVFSLYFWIIAILTSIYPAIFFIRSYRRRRVRRQALRPCHQCGYDLQGNESGVCPECGDRVASSSTTEVAG